MLIIPGNFKEKLDGNYALNNAMMKTIEELTPIFEDNKLYFFPEYTDHGINHINNVLALAAEIIEEETYSKLTCNDIMVLIIAILLHDSGMHINFEGFNCLINTNLYDQSIENVYGDKTWHQLWEEFIDDAKLWDNKKKKLIFGENTKIKDIPNSELNLTTADRMFIGEFLRRNHPRLAYDIALIGFPMVNDVNHFLKDLDINTIRIIGHIARSHGENLWSMLTYTENEFGRDQIRIVNNVNIIFLMTVIRIADYFDIDKDRANMKILSTRKLQSVLSDIEWSKHNCVEDIEMKAQDDSESIFIRISPPESSLVYLEVEKLIKDLQNELDISWAVIGKVYGRVKDVKDLKLSFRRVNSNLNNNINLLKKIKYVPERIKFDVNPNIIHMLIKPLYGSNPSFGIRELVQNSVDACIEKEMINQDLVSNYKSKIIIKIEDSNDEKGILTIKDNGIGMNKNVLKNYFLIAGASYRDNEEWKEKFINEDKTIVSRSGRFGVGVLAAFLLGEKISVCSLAYGNTTQYSFEATVDTNQIEMIKDEVSRISGTEIKVELTKTVMNELKNQLKSNRYNSYNREISWYEWYHFNDPSLEISVPENWGKIKKLLLADFKKENLGTEWCSIYPDKYQRVDWKYQSEIPYGDLFCNGISIPSKYDFRKYSFPSILRFPIVSVIDNEANLPLTLSRSAIDGGYLPFEFDLISDIYKDIIAKLLMETNNTMISNGKIELYENRFAHSAIGENDYKIENTFQNVSEQYILNNFGFCLSHGYNLEYVDSKTIIKAWVNKDLNEINDQNLLSILKNNVVISNDLPNSIYDYKACLESDVKNVGDSYEFNSEVIYMNKDKYKYLFDTNSSRLTKGFISSMNKIKESKMWVCLSRNKSFKCNINLNELDSLTYLGLVVQYKFKKGLGKNKDRYGSEYYNIELFKNLMTKYIGENIIIPYDMEERKTLYPAAFKELAEYMYRYKK